MHVYLCIIIYIYRHVSVHSDYVYKFISIYADTPIYYVKYVYICVCVHIKYFLVISFYSWHIDANEGVKR